MGKSASNGCSTSEIHSSSLSANKAALKAPLTRTLRRRQSRPSLASGDVRRPVNRTPEARVGQNNLPRGNVRAREGMKFQQDARDRQGSGIRVEAREDRSWPSRMGLDDARARVRRTGIWEDDRGCRYPDGDPDDSDGTGRAGNHHTNGRATT